MKNILLTVFAVTASLVGYSQQKYYDFETLPANFSTSGVVPLSLSSEHTKDGQNGLKWEVAKGGVLTASNLGISRADIGSYRASMSRLFIYSKQATNDTLILRFYNKAGVLKREGHMLLNYKGWRDYHRSYRHDYNYGKELPEFELDKMEIIYKPEKPSTKATLYLDAFTMVGDANARVIGPHMKLDMSHFLRKLKLNSSLIPPDMEIKPATTQELLDAQKIALLYRRKIPQIAPEKVAIAKKFVDDLAIHRNADGSIAGKGITDLDQTKTFMLASQYGSFLAEAAINNNDKEAKEKLLMYTEYLLDQGLAEGGNTDLGITAYDHSRNFMWGFIEAMPLYPPKMKEDVIKLLKSVIYYNRIYSTEVEPDTDYVYLYSEYLFEIAALAPTQDEFVRDLKCISRYFSLFSEVQPGAADGMKPDGCVSHHNAPYIGYCHALNTYVGRVYSLKGTLFRITPRAYQNLKTVFEALFLQSSKGSFIANASSGRNIISGGFPLSGIALEKLAEIGGDIVGKPFDSDLASFYNYIYKKNKYSIPNKDFDGFYQFNYAQTGVVHKNNWTAVMKGFTNRLWGSEIFANQNRYGRYQSYGALEVMYNGDRVVSGYLAKDRLGWDWNVAPGTTTVHLPYDQLQAIAPRVDESQKNSFVGALSLGKYGIFAMDFAEREKKEYNNLKFHKSVFAFDDVLVCLGSGISSTNATSITATNLFQTVYNESNPSIYVNNNEIKDTDYKQVVSTKGKGAWVLNAPGTGYYVFKGGGDITVVRGEQTTPADGTLTGTPTNTSIVCKAYINHGTAPKNTNYRFVVVPRTTAKQMQNFTKQFEKGKLFTVLSQTDSLHVVKWLPDNTTAYAFFEANPQVNIGVVKSISGKALLGVTENKNGLTITINNPDLNTVDVNDINIKWRSSEYKVKLQLKGNWKETENPSNSLVSNDKQSTTIEFSLIDGLSTTIKLKRDIDRNQ